MKPSWPMCSASRLRLPAGVRLPHAGVALDAHGVGARRVPVCVSKRVPDRQAPPPSRITLQWPAGATPWRKSPTKHPCAIIDSLYSEKKFTSGPRLLTDIGARMSAAGVRADVLAHPMECPGVAKKRHATGRRCCLVASGRAGLRFGSS